MKKPNHLQSLSFHYAVSSYNMIKLYIEQVMSFTYLDIQITSYQDLEMEVKAKALRISDCLNNLYKYILKKIQIFKNLYFKPNKHLKKEVKVRIYKSVDRPILTYASETRPETAKTPQILEAAEMRTLKRILNLTLFDREKSDNI